MFWEQPAVWLAAAVVVLVIAVASRWKRSVTPQVTEEIRQAARDAAAKCVCGELATHPAPVLKRGRGAWDWLRNLFAAPPRYTRHVDAMSDPVFCKTHAHVADAAVDQWLFETRAGYASKNKEVAQSAANFEQEYLAKMVSESLTENQKLANRKGLRAVTSIAPNGTTG